VNRPYRAAIRRVDHLIDGGNSLSGNEPNCAFLNLGDNTFATVSALAGFDFPDDARALALVDWDNDGDLDVWSTNRTAPMVRYLHNDTPAAGRSLMVKLEGLSASRDAAGARVAVRLAGQPEKPIVRTVKFGEGYLGQSSRWLHFGLGSAEIASVQVTWPGGKREDIAGCRPGIAVEFTEGDQSPRTTPLKAAAKATPPSALEVRPGGLAGAVSLFHPALFPPLPSLDPAGKAWTVTDESGPVLINLFASWCPDCAGELTQWSKEAARFKEAGLNVVLLTADGRDTLHKTTPADAWAWLRKANIPFTAGVLTDEAFRRLTTMHRQLFGAIVNLPIPTSFLLDGKGRLVAVYRGSVPVDRLLADLDREKTGFDRSAVLPWPGRWLQVPEQPDPAYWINDLAAARQWLEAFALLQRHEPLLRQHRSFALMAGAMGSELAAAGHWSQAIKASEAALAKAPADPSQLNNLANLLLTVPDTTLRQPARALELASLAVSGTGGKNAAILDTLASAQAAAGDLKAAVATLIKAAAIARESGDTALLPLLEKNLRTYKAAIPPP
jgi:thiol-disulfide isomerase/thioredoxin